MKNIGKVIKELRERQEISVNDLADGICSGKYIYKIERGEGTPSLYILTEIFLKLKYDIYDFIPLLNFANPLLCAEIISELDEARENGDFELLENKLNKLNKNIEFEADFQQYLDYNHAIIYLFKDKNYTYALNTIKTALALTGKELSDRNYHMLHLSVNEIRLVILYGVYLTEMEELGDSEKLLRAINNYLESLYHNSEYHKVFILSVVNLSICLIGQKKYSESVEMLIECKNKMLDGKYSTRLQAIYYLLSLNYYHLKEYKEAKKLVHVARQLAEDYKDIRTLNYCNILISKLGYIDETYIDDDFDSCEEIIYGNEGDELIKLKSLSNNVVLYQFKKYERGSLDLLADCLESVYNTFTKNSDNFFFIGDFREYQFVNDIGIVELDNFYSRLSIILKEYNQIEGFWIIDNPTEELSNFIRIMDKFELNNLEKFTTNREVGTIKHAIEIIKIASMSN